MKPIKMLFVVLIVGALALAACGGKEPATQAAPQAQATTAATAAEQAKPTVPPTKPAVREEPTATPEPPTAEPTPDELALSSVTEGLAALKSYKSTFTLAWEGKDKDGNPTSGAWDMVEEYTREPLAQRVVITSQENDEPAQPFEMITIGDVAYMVSTDDEGKTSCTSFSSEDTGVTDQGLFTPDMLGSVSGARYVGTETVNGMRTRHYVWKEGSVVFAGFASASGDIWVTPDQDVVVKYATKATGKGAFFGNLEEEGTLGVDYELTEIDGDFEITPPEGCKGPATDIPQMADAQDRATFGEMLTYSTPSAMADVVAFYKAEMPKAGWEASGEPTEMEGLAMIDFTKEGRKASVMISYDEDSKLCSVVITMSEE